MNTHKTTIHARCPYAPVWDYYELTFETRDFLKCEDLQEACDLVRGREITQEVVFASIALRLSEITKGKLTLAGRHGQNGGLTISESIPSIHGAT